MVWVRAMAGILLAVAASGASAQEESVTWQGSYACAGARTLFGGAPPIETKVLRIAQKGASLQGQADAAMHEEAFHGSLGAGGELTLVADGFWRDNVQRVTTLSATGRVSGSQLTAAGKRTETLDGRKREADCVIMLSRVESVKEVPPQPGPAAPVAPVAAPPVAANAPAGAPVPLQAIPPAAVAATPAVTPAPQQPIPPLPGRRRRALVIGNDNYRHVAPLRNARADARAIGDALALAGFTVTARTDLDERGLKEALRHFRAEVQGGDEIVLYFAGHGVQFSSANYLLPVDIRSEGEEQVRDESVPLQRILDDFADRRAGFTLAIIDACRDNPFRSAGRSIGGRGLAPTSAATGQMIIFSAGAGQQALDRLGPADTDPNGLFTRVFLREMDREGVTVDRVLRQVRNEVVRLARSVGHEQTPALYDQAVGDFYLRAPR